MTSGLIIFSTSFTNVVFCEPASVNRNEPSSSWAMECNKSVTMDDDRAGSKWESRTSDVSIAAGVARKQLSDGCYARKHSLQGAQAQTHTHRRQPHGTTPPATTAATPDMISATPREVPVR